MRSIAAGLLLTVAACRSPAAPVKQPVPTAVLPPLTSAPTTLEQTLAPVHPLLTRPDPGPSYDPAVLARWIDVDGYGATRTLAGEPLLPQAPPNLTPALAGPNPKLLARFVHLPDTQLADDESPTRLAQFDLPGTTNAAFRPQEGDQCRILDAAVRTINLLHQKQPISFVLTGGDNVDDAQRNEVQWFMQVMGGAPVVKCDSGDHDDPVPGPNNDGKDPFLAEGLAMRWWWVTGNHDVLVQGTHVVNDQRRKAAIGENAPSGTRDYSQPGGPISTGPIAADDQRLPLLRAELMALVASDGDGHGVGADQVKSGKATYAFDVAGSPLRFVIFDTSAETGADAAVIHQADVDATIRPLLDKARSDGKLVVIASHHATSSISDGSGFGGTRQTDALTPQAWIDLLGSYDNIYFSIVGHSHQNRVRYVAPPAGHGFWEVMTSALSDYPHQFRLVEIWDDDNGWLRLRGVVVNYATEGDPVALAGRARGVADRVSGWGSDGAGTATDRNVELFIPKP